MKKLFMLTGLFTLLFISLSLAKMPIDVEVNSKKLAFDTAPYIHNGHVYVPLRTSAEALGLNCSWNEANKSAHISSDSEVLIFYPDKDSVYSNGNKLSLEIHLADGRISVPVRFLSEQLGLSVSWDPLYYRVMLDSEKDVPSHLLDKTYNQDEVYWLSKIIFSEAGGESLTGQIAVGNVVLNRVASTDFPNTIYSVIFDRAGGVQFEPVINGSIHLTPTHSSVEAAKRALSGENAAGESLFFLNPTKAQNFWILQNRTFYTSIGNHDFYL